MALRILALATEAYGAGGAFAKYNRDRFQALALFGNVADAVILACNGQTKAQDSKC